MAGKTRKKVREEDVTGLKYFDRLAPLLKRLHDDGCEPDKAGNRQLHFDQYCMLVLLYLFNPTVSSMRAIQQASELKKCNANSAVAGHRSVRFPKPRTFSIPTCCSG